jgi:hypothetical protein
MNSAHLCIDTPRPHCSSIESIDTLQSLLDNPCTEDLSDTLVQLYKSMLRQSSTNSWIRRKKQRVEQAPDNEDDQNNQNHENNDGIFRESPTDFGGAGGFDEFEHIDLPRSQPVVTLQLSKRLSIRDNDILSDLLLADENHMQSKSQQRQYCPSMQGKSLKFLNYLKDKMTEDETSFTFTDLIATQDSILASLSFYHLCVLATNDMINVQQEEAYGDILVTKGRLFDNASD